MTNVLEITQHDRVRGSIDSSVALTDGMLEASWRLRRVQLSDNLLTTIPNPARVVVLDQAFGFHGPINTALTERVAREVPTQ